MSRYHYLLYVNPRGKHIAHCLDFDIVTSADSRDEALRRIDVLVDVHTNGTDVYKGSTTRTPAPAEFWKRFKKCEQRCIADEPVAAKNRTGGREVVNPISPVLPSQTTLSTEAIGLQMTQPPDPPAASAEQVAQELAEELRHCIDQFEDGWGFNIAMAKDVILRYIRRAHLAGQVQQREKT